MTTCFSGLAAFVRNICPPAPNAEPAAGTADTGAPPPQPASPARTRENVRPRGYAAFRAVFRRQQPGSPAVAISPARPQSIAPQSIAPDELPPAPDQAQTVSTSPVRPAPGGAQSGILDLRGVRISSGSLGSVASSHAAVLVQQDAEVYRLKFNHHGPIATFHEVLAARMNKFLFAHPYAPEVKFGAHTFALPPMDGKYTRVGIASKMVDGFQDWGDFLVRERGGTCAALQHVLPEDRPAYQALLANYRGVQRRIAEIRNGGGHSEQVSALLAKPKQPYQDAPRAAVAALQPLRLLSREALRLQDQMLALLPPPFHQALVQAFYESEALGNWDFANHERANVGFVIVDDELKGATVVDFGVCGLIGFSGKPKQECEASIGRPARVDDPFLSVPEMGPGGEYLPGAVLNRSAVTDFTNVSQSAGVVGSLPRSASFAALMRQVISDQSLYGTKPELMLRTARRLAQLSQEDVRRMVRSLCDECRSSPDPAVREMLCEITETPDQIADSYYRRFSAIVQRAELPAPPARPRRSSI